MRQERYFRLRQLTPERAMISMRGLPWKHSLLALCLCLAVGDLAGCMAAAPYAPRRAGQSTGYTDRELAPNRFRVTFTGNSATPREQVEDDLLLRAAEVTLAAGYSHFVFDTRNTQAQTRYSAIPQ